jgi:hypothetical protein
MLDSISGGLQGSMDQVLCPYRRKAPVKGTENGPYRGKGHSLGQGGKDVGVDHQAAENDKDQ